MQNKLRAENWDSSEAENSEELIQQSIDEIECFVKDAESCLKPILHFFNDDDAIGDNINDGENGFDFFDFFELFIYVWDNYKILVKAKDEMLPLFANPAHTNILRIKKLFGRTDWDWNLLQRAAKKISFYLEMHTLYFKALIHEGWPLHQELAACQELKKMTGSNYFKYGVPKIYSGAPQFNFDASLLPNKHSQTSRLMCLSSKNGVSVFGIKRLFDFQIIAEASGDFQEGEIYACTIFCIPFMDSRKIYISNIYSICESSEMRLVETVLSKSDLRAMCYKQLMAMAGR
jgi:hypothetical protein